MCHLACGRGPPRRDQDRPRAACEGRHRADQRRAALLGPLERQLQLAAGYQLKLVRSVCNGAEKHPTAVYIDHFRQAYGLLRQEQLVGGGETAETRALAAACLNRIKFQLTGEIDATVDNSNGGLGWIGHVVMHATATVTGDGARDVIESDKPAMQFDTQTAKADVLWDDAEQIQLAVNGMTGGLPPAPAAIAASAWKQDFNDRTKRIAMELDKDTVKKANNGNCLDTLACTTFSYSATLSGRQLMN